MGIAANALGFLLAVAGAGGDASVHFGGVGSFPAPQAVAV